VARASARSTKLHHQQWVGGRSATGVICRQSLYAAPLRWHGGSAAPDDAPTITLTFLQPDDTTRQVPARVGETLLQTAHRNDIDLEGACEGVCACSTCHLILPPDLYGTLPDPSEDEEDMLDMAFGLTETSRLGCQITVTSDMDGAILEMPKATRNFYVDGHVPKPH
jgi:ferredoxin-2, mitochondrial